MNNIVSLIIGADVVPTKSNKDLFEKAEISSLLDNKLKEIWQASDFRIFNLEVPLTDKETPIEKCGSNLIASTSTVTGIKALNPNLILLANNHIMDQGVEGLTSTLNTLRKNDIEYIGVGVNLKHILHSFVFEKNNIKIAIYNCSETEFSLATNDTPGANPFDPFESLGHISELKKNNDYVIACFHGGKEFYPYPSPYLQKVFRKIADAGADVVIAQHTHCIGCEEKYQDSYLIYGQGNFIFDMPGKIAHDQNGLLVNVKCSKKDLSVEYIPIRNTRGKTEYSPNGEIIIRDFLKRSEEIKQFFFINQNYSYFANNNLSYYLRIFRGNTFLSKVLCKLSKHLFLFLCKKKNLLAMQNIIRCEAHRELFIQGLKGFNNEKRRDC